METTSNVVAIPHETWLRMQDYIRKENLLKAIIVIRKEADLGLAHAKGYVESYRLDIR